MSNNLRILLGVLGAAVLAALATPELAGKLPPGLAQILAGAVGLALHQLNPKAPEPTPPAQ